MSVDAYFCFCCLSTNDLINLFSEKPDTDYAAILNDLFAIKPLQDHYEYDSYICHECARCLVDAQKFKRQVLETLNALQVNGLIQLNKTAEHTVVTKVLNDYTSELDEKYEDKMYDQKPSEEVDQDLKNPSLIKPEEDNIILEREKRITVARKQKREPVKTEVLYEVTEDFKCPVCALVLPNLYVYHTHMNKHFPNHICETCGKGFLTQKRLKRHMPSHIKGPFKCEECDAVFSNYNSMNSHRQRKHGSGGLYACAACAARFPSLSRRARHLAAAHGARAAHACPLCHQRFLLAGNLSTHMRAKHLQVKRHFCGACGAGFFHKHELRGHAASHTGHNEFQCTQCPKSYPRKNALTVHMRTHKDDRRFCCEKCGKKFLQKCTLTTHYKTHSRIDEKQEIQQQS